MDFYYISIHIFILIHLLLIINALANSLVKPNAEKRYSFSLVVHISNQHILSLLHDSDKSMCDSFGKIKQRRVGFNDHLFGAAADLAGWNVCNVARAIRDPTIITSCSTRERTLRLNYPPVESSSFEQTDLWDQPLTCPLFKERTLNKQLLNSMCKEKKAASCFSSRGICFRK